MRKLHLIWIGFLLCVWLGGLANAATYELADGQSLTGDIISFNEEGIIFRTPDDKYSDRVPWTKFSQNELRKFDEDKKMTAFVEPFITVSEAERLKQSVIEPKTVPRLPRPEVHSLLGAMFSSSTGVFVLLLLYAANLYAAFEIAIFRARPIALVCGVSAIAPLIGPILFLSLPTQLPPPEATDGPPAPIQTFSVTPPPTAEAAPAEAGGLRIAEGEASKGSPGVPQTQSFQRGAFTFNRRFMETKFPGFFGMVRRDAEKDLVLQIKSARGTYTATRISRITANDMHVQVIKGHASEEVLIPYSEIQEIQLKHKDA